jgi:hypothetical protein
MLLFVLPFYVIVLCYHFWMLSLLLSFVLSFCIIIFAIISPFFIFVENMTNSSLSPISRLGGHILLLATFQRQFI